MSLQIGDNASGAGFISVSRIDKETGEVINLVEKPNLILRSGAELLAAGLAGSPNSKISHLYVGYCNSSTGIFTPPVIDVTNSNPMTGYAAPFGYLRLPLTLPATFLNDTGYNRNISVFSLFINTAVAAGGAPFQTSGSPGPSWIFEIALVAASDPNNAAGDKIFSRANFTPVQYVSTYALGLNWGIKFLAS